MKKKMIFCLLIGLSSAVFGLDPAPSNPILCSAELFPASYKIPLNGILPFLFELKAQETESTSSSVVQFVELQTKYVGFYSNHWIKPLGELPQGVAKKFVSARDVDRNSVWFRLTRFPQTEKRVAGMALEFSAERGYYGAFLLEPLEDGYTRTIIAPIKLDNQLLNLLVHCRISQLP